MNFGSAESHLAFIEAHGFPFDLLVDEGRLVAETYGAIRADGSGIARTVVVVGKDGRVLYRKAGSPPPGELLEAIRSADDATGSPG
ncbi:MAG: redoxin domain-containing protein [Chloroflexia bacterium]|nr:redoxin domain-containing protein [Chloroflexia bacterium]